MRVGLGLFSLIGSVFWSIMWLESTFAYASDVRDVKVSLIQIQIEATRKELRSLRRDRRRARGQDVRYIDDDIDEVTDLLKSYTSNKRILLNAK